MLPITNDCMLGVVFCCRWNASYGKDTALDTHVRHLGPGKLHCYTSFSISPSNSLFICIMLYVRTTMEISACTFLYICTMFFTFYIK